MNNVLEIPAAVAQENETLLAALRQGEAALNASLVGLSEEAAHRRPSADRWSALECVEHVAIGEEFLLGLIVNKRRPRRFGAPNLESRILSQGASRTTRIQSTGHARPRGRFATLPEAVDAFRAARRRSEEFLQQNDEDLRATEVTHPNHAIGAISSYECVLLMAAHVERHARQIEEIFGKGTDLATA